MENEINLRLKTDAENLLKQYENVPKRILILGELLGEMIKERMRNDLRGRLSSYKTDELVAIGGLLYKAAIGEVQPAQPAPVAQPAQPAPVESPRPAQPTPTTPTHKKKK